MLPMGAMRILIEDGTFPHLLIYALLEWMMIILLFVDGFLTFLSNEIAKVFELRTPCLLCTRLDHALGQRDSNLYYNESICEVHKRDISALAYCHVHKRLSDIRSMCQGCLLAFSTEKVEPSLDCSKNVFDEERKMQLKPLKMEMNVSDERIGMFRCSCCGEPMKPKSSSIYSRSLSIGSHAPSPRTPWYPGRNDEGGNMDSLPSRYTELKLSSVSHSPENEPASVVGNHGAGRGEDVALLPEEMIEDAPKTPMFWSRNRFFGIPLTDSVPVSPNCSSKKVPDKPVDILEPIDEGEGDGESLVRLKRQATLDSRSLMALYMELDEERSASAVAANNAMAMITRLQAEKAAVQMEALQYQRMMEEQAEYDEEAVQMMKDLIFKSEEEMKDLEDELEMYKEEYGTINTEDLGDEDTNSHKEEGALMESVPDYEGERSQLLGQLRELEMKMCSPTPNKEHLAREVAMIRERLRAVEGESGFLRHAAITLQRGGQGIELLTEIAQHLRKLRQNQLN